MSINTMSENTIENIGTTYMSGMNEQVSLHFETIIDLRLTMAESIAHIAADEETSGYGSKEEIEYGAKARHFLCFRIYYGYRAEACTIPIKMSQAQGCTSVSGAAGS